VGQPLAARLVPEMELGVFRIAQEAVRNALHHARACTLCVSLRFEPGELQLTITDDGCDFSPQGPDEREPVHLGLRGMAERARLLGGKLEVRSAPGEGTVVEAIVPVAPQRDRPVLVAL